jgi:threonine dehydrogenase-like Zn-dependent dehydrogenase
VAVELSGAPQAIVQMFRAADKGARIVPVGLAGQPEVALPYTDIVRSGVQIHTVFRYVNQFPAALNLLERGLIDWKPLVTHTFPLEEAVAAFALIQERKSEVIKAVLTMD